ncbi:hypothetical protein Pelo_5088 [Pelomyxa schiedti]|nr:hypothetical protein Pelo_5088 [Pelomyxa schiedti]
MVEKFNFVDEYLEVTKASGSRLWLSQPMKRIKVSSTTPVSELRLLILQEMEIEPVRQRLTFVNPITRKTTELKTGTLGENKVTQTSTITVAELDEDDPTIMEELGGVPLVATTKRALAFEGTGLSSTPMPKPPPPPTTQTAAPKGKPCPSCTFINPLKATSCEMCEGAL